MKKGYLWSFPNIGPDERMVIFNIFLMSKIMINICFNLGIFGKNEHFKSKILMSCELWELFQESSSKYSEVWV